MSGYALNVGRHQVCRKGRTTPAHATASPLAPPVMKAHTFIRRGIVAHEGGPPIDTTARSTHRVRRILAAGLLTVATSCSSPTRESLDNTTVESTSADRSVQWSASIDSTSTSRHGGVNDLTTVDERTLLVGWVADEPTQRDRRAAIWSLDAAGITLVSDTALPADGTELLAIAARGDQLIAVGYVPADQYQLFPGLWSSSLTAPATWQLELTGGVPGQFVDVALEENAGVAVANVRANGANRGMVITEQAGVWGTPIELEAPPGNVAMTGVASNGAGTFVAVGLLTSPEGYELLTWRSPDGGRTWTLTEAPGDYVLRSVDLVGFGRGTFFITGSDANDRPLVLQSADGGAWATRTIELSDGSDSATFGSYLVDGDRILLGGRTWFTGWRASPSVVEWTSAGVFYVSSIGPITQPDPPGSPLLLSNPVHAQGDPWLVQHVPGTFVVRSWSTDPVVHEPGGAIPEGGPHTNIAAVAPITDGLLTMGYRSPVARPDLGEGVTGPELLVSLVRGSTWVPVTGLDGHDPSTLVDAVEADGVIVAVGVGSPTTPASAGDLNDIAVVRFDAAGTLLGVTTIPGDGDQNARSITHAADGWWITGTSVDRSGDHYTEGRLWYSADLQTWTRVDGPFSVERAGVNEVCEPQPGQIVAVGRLTDANGHQRAVMWTRAGDTWVEEPLANTAANSYMRGCATNNGTLVVLGVLDGMPVMWTGHVGAMTAVPLGSNQIMTSVAAYGSGFVAAGGDGQGYFTVPMVLSSPDGVQWSVQPAPGIHLGVYWSIDHLLALESSVVLSGRLGSISIVWTAALPLPGDPSAGS